MLRALLTGPESGESRNGQVDFFKSKLGKLFIATFFAITAIGAAPVSAALVSYSDTQVMTQDGQDFIFLFDNLAPSDGSGGTITISSGISRKYGEGSSLAGFDLDNSSDYFDLTFDGASQDTYNCTGRGDHTEIEDATDSTGGNCKFELTISLSGQALDALLADAFLSVGVLFSSSVSNWGHEDEIIVTLEYTEAVISEVPLPAALPLFIAGIAGIGAVSRRRRNAKQRKLAAR